MGYGKGEDSMNLNKKEKERLFEAFFNELTTIEEEQKEKMKKQSKFIIQNKKVCFENIKNNKEE